MALVGNKADLESRREVSREVRFFPFFFPTNSMCVNHAFSVVRVVVVHSSRVSLMGCF